MSWGRGIFSCAAFFFVMKETDFSSYADNTCYMTAETLEDVANSDISEVLVIHKFEKFFQ